MAVAVADCAASETWLAAAEACSFTESVAFSRVEDVVVSVAKSLTSASESAKVYSFSFTTMLGFSSSICFRLLLCCGFLAGPSSLEGE